MPYAKPVLVFVDVARIFIQGSHGIGEDHNAAGEMTVGSSTIIIE